MGDIFLFSFSYWNPEALADFLGSDFKNIANRSKSCVLKDYERVFAGVSDNWEGTSFPTLIVNKSQETKGFFTRISEKEFNQFDKYETLSQITDVKLFPKDGQPPIEGVAFMQANPDKFVYPCYSLIEACAKTDSAYYYLDND
jgi:hypothetical protein